MVPVTPPPTLLDVTLFPVQIVMRPDGPGEPESGDYVDASWVDGQAATTLAAQGIVAGGRYKLWVKVTTSQEVRVMAGPVVGVGY